MQELSEAAVTASGAREMTSAAGANDRVPRYGVSSSAEPDGLDRTEAHADALRERTRMPQLIRKPFAGCARRDPVVRVFPSKRERTSDPSSSDTSRHSKGEL